MWLKTVGDVHKGGVGVELRASGRGVTYSGLCVHHGYGSSRAFEMLRHIYLAGGVVSHQKTLVCMVTAWRNSYLTRFSWFLNYQVI